MSCLHCWGERYRVISGLITENKNNVHNILLILKFAHKIEEYTASRAHYDPSFSCVWCSSATVFLTAPTMRSYVVWRRQAPLTPSSPVSSNRRRTALLSSFQCFAVCAVSPPPPPLSRLFLWHLWWLRWLYVAFLIVFLSLSWFCIAWLETQSRKSFCHNMLCVLWIDVSFCFGAFCEWRFVSWGIMARWWCISTYQ